MTEDPDSIDLARWLGEDAAWPGEDSDGEATDQGTPVHHSITSCAIAAADGAGPLKRPVSRAFIQLSARHCLRVSWQILSTSPDM
jgi:hypothetical protein